jgi:hypothetical protein
MHSKRIYILTYLLFSSCLIFSQTISLPFYLDKRKHIIVSYIIKGEKVKLLLDTGWEGDMIDTQLADKLNTLPHKQNRAIDMLTSSGEHYTEILPDNGTSKYIDTLFNYPWTLTDIKKTAKSLRFDDATDGIVGIDFNNSKYILEFDFKHNQLKFWNSLPQNYLKGREFYKATLLRSDYGQESKYSCNFAKYPNIKGSLSILDTVQLHPLFFFDTGSTASYLSLQIYDSLILKQLIDYKKIISQKYGPDYPTIHCQIPELGIDSFCANCSVTRVMPDVFNLYKKNHLRVLLGMNFFLQYEKVIFDFKRKIGYFIKRN